jgi:hypothetical protein
VLIGIKGKIIKGSGYDGSGAFSKSNLMASFPLKALPVCSNSSHFEMCDFSTKWAGFSSSTTKHL